jgi:glycosyltransferase involved in cell wall biosynthesis
MRVLMISFQFPPQADTSGVQRVLRFVQDLAPLGWDSSVVTARASAYERIDAADLPAAVLPPGTVVHRPFTPDAKRHFALAGRYPAWLARPDRWVAWVPVAVAAGLAAVRRERPQVLWSSYPIASAHLAAHALSRLTGLPWVADFRDPMAHDGYPADPALWRSFRRVEERVFARARRMVFTTAGAAALYRARYPARAADCAVVPNGYDEASFELAAARPRVARPAGAPLRLLHSGVVYPEWRDPGALFEAMARLRRSHPGLPAWGLDFRAAGHEAFVQQRAGAHGVLDQLRLLPPLPYVDALAEMLAADALLLLQGAGCNDQIPAKLYEYLRARRPILGLADPGGATGAALQAAGVPLVAALEDPAAIAAALVQCLSDVQQGRAVLPQADAVAAASRRQRAAQLAALFDTVRRDTARPA